MYLGSGLLYIQGEMLHEVIEEALLENPENNRVHLKASFLSNEHGQTSRRACPISFVLNDLMADTGMFGHGLWKNVNEF